MKSLKDSVCDIKNTSFWVSAWETDVKRKRGVLLNLLLYERVPSQTYSWCIWWYLHAYLAWTSIWRFLGQEHCISKDRPKLAAWKLWTEGAALWILAQNVFSLYKWFAISSYCKFANVFSLDWFAISGFCLISCLLSY